MKACGWCGWSHIYGWNCDHERGARADRLVEALNKIPTIEATKIGHGYGNVGVEIGKTTVITLDVWPSGLSQITHIRWNRADDIAGMVHVLCELAESLDTLENSNVRSFPEET